MITERRKLLREKYRKYQSTGKGASETAEHFKVSTAAIYYALRDDDYKLPQSTRKPIDRELRDKVLETKGYKCFYCNCRMSGINATVDHLNSVRLGGEDHMDNLEPACRKCNSTKNFYNLNDFIEWLYLKIDMGNQNQQHKTIRKAKYAVRVLRNFNRKGINTNMIKSKFYEEKKRKEKEEVIKLYKEGITLRDLAWRFSKSRQWVWLKVRHLNNEKYLTKTETQVV